MGNIRNGDFIADRDYPMLLDMLKRWRLPNGLFRGMSQGQFHYMGAMTECLGIIGPMSAMLIQSWEGAIRVFPAWPTHLDASYRDLRTRGAFLVSSQLEDGEVQYIEIKSEHGGDCRIINPWDARILGIIHNGVESKIHAGDEFAMTTSRDDVIIVKP